MHSALGGSDKVRGKMWGLGLTFCVATAVALATWMMPASACACTNPLKEAELTELYALADQIGHLKPSDLIRYTKLYERYKHQAAFVYGKYPPLSEAEYQRPLSETDWQRLFYVEDQLKNGALPPSSARLKLELEGGQLLKRHFDFLMRLPNDSLLRLLFRNMLFPDGTRLLNSGQVVIGPFGPTVSDFTRYWVWGQAPCLKGFEEDCEIGKEDEKQRLLANP